MLVLNAALNLMRRYHKLHVIMGGWWWKERRPAPDSLFCPYNKIPKEARALLERCVHVSDTCVESLICPYINVPEGTRALLNAVLQLSRLRCP